MTARVKRSRAKGSKLPANTRCVDRTSSLGNPWRIVPPGGRYLTSLTTERALDSDEVTTVRKYGYCYDGFIVVDPGGMRYPEVYKSKAKAAERAVAEYAAAIDRGDPRVPTKERIRAELAGRDVACWCELEDPCHGDVLLAIARGDR